MGAEFSAADILEATGGLLVRGEPSLRVCGVSTDSRTLRPGELFVPLRGPRFDGHRFLGEALAKGAGGALWQEGLPLREEAESDRFLVCVPNTLAALGELAAWWRRRHPIPLVAVTGSNGKTTAKEMVASILEGRG
ncbi:MAG: Mur ligase domain-containing protein, partial [Nitrospinota bacterium]